jgi:hypothetical protein
MGLIRTIKDRLRDSALHRWLCQRKDTAELAEWENQGHPQPPPQAFKRWMIQDIARRSGMRVMVETGTNFGHTVAASLSSFEIIHTVELFDPLYENAQRRFARFPKVKLHHGDSAHELPLILAELREPALFWLDAHYSGDGTARAAIDTPIVQELQTISNHAVKNHVILIDDARLFDGTNGYPTMDDCRASVSGFWPAHQFSVENDVISITPPNT